MCSISDIDPNTGRETKVRFIDPKTGELSAIAEVNSKSGKYFNKKFFSNNYGFSSWDSPNPIKISVDKGDIVRTTYDSYESWNPQEISRYDAKTNKLKLRTTFYQWPQHINHKEYETKYNSEGKPVESILYMDNENPHINKKMEKIIYDPETSQITKIERFGKGRAKIIYDPLTGAPLSKVHSGNLNDVSDSPVITFYASILLDSEMSSGIKTETPFNRKIGAYDSNKTIIYLPDGTPTYITWDYQFGNILKNLSLIDAATNKPRRVMKFKYDDTSADFEKYCDMENNISSCCKIDKIIDYNIETGKPKSVMHYDKSKCGGYKIEYNEQGIPIKKSIYPYWGFEPTEVIDL